MALVRFAATCDRCQARSAEYEAWPTCRECLDHICPTCSVPESDREREDDEGGVYVTNICTTCEDDNCQETER